MCVSFARTVFGALTNILKLCSILSMGRGPSLETIPKVEARRIRRLLAEARDLLELTNQDIADERGYDRRSITNAFAAERPLKASTAYGIYSAIHFARLANRKGPGREKVASILSEVAASATLAPYFKERYWPPAIVPRWETETLANFLAAQLASSVGVGAIRRRQYANKLRGALDRSCRHMAISAAITYAKMLSQNGHKDADGRAGEMLKNWGFGSFRYTHGTIRPFWGIRKRKR
jgi:hypothetical protein